VTLSFIHLEAQTSRPGSGIRGEAFMKNMRPRAPLPTALLFQGGDGSSLTPSNPAKYAIAFENGGGVRVRIDCNRGHGGWKSAGPNQLQFRLAHPGDVSARAP